MLVIGYVVQICCPKSTWCGNQSILEKVALVMLQSCEISTEILDFTQNDGDNILQYILEPALHQHVGDKSQLEARLCQLLARKLSFHQLCHRNNEGICALSYAEEYVLNTRPSWHDGDWLRVRDAIKENMLMRCKENVASFEHLVRTVHELWNGLSELDDPLRHTVGSTIAGLEDALSEGWRRAVTPVSVKIVRHFYPASLRREKSQQRSHRMTLHLIP